VLATIPDAGKDSDFERRQADSADVRADVPRGHRRHQQRAKAF